MKVSVAMITYNHENYIRKSIESVLMQACDFDFELIISNDCSTDNTHNIIQDILQNNSNSKRIKYFDNDKNIGMMPNFIKALNLCQGKYIAICEGDDYWTDSLKIQKQVDFLEANQAYSICFHRVKILRGDAYFDDIHIESRFNKIKKEPASLKDLIEQGNFIHTASVMYRNYNIDFPFEFKCSSVGDYFLHIINAQKGFIKRLNEVMAVYREGVGIYSSLSSTKMLKKIIIYQTCILSYLKDDTLNSIMLNKAIDNIETLEYRYTNRKYLSEVLSFKSLMKIFLLKINKKFKK